jgi:tetratricopeptide (TPR) repeat protein
MNGTPGDDLSLAAPDDSELLHLLTCPICRSWVIGRLLERNAGAGDDPDGTATYEEVFVRLEERVPELFEQMQSRRAEEERLLAEILRAPRGSRLRKIRGARFRRPGLMDLLLERSHEHQLTDPRLAGDLADLAARLATLLSGEEEMPASALSRAFCLGASSCRLRRDAKGAEEKIARAASFLAGTPDRAFYSRTVALLRWEQGRADEAAALLHHAARLYLLDGLPEEESTCLALLGLLHVEEPALGNAFALLHEGWAGMDRDLRPLLALRVGLALAFLLAESGQEEKTRSLLREIWRFHAQVADPEEMIRVYWLEARVLARLGDREEARHLLEAVFRKLLEEKSLAESTLAGMDFALLLVESGHPEEIRPLAANLESAFAGVPALVLARTAFGDFSDLIDGGEPCLREMAVAILSGLFRAFRAAGVWMKPIPFV